MNKLAPSPSQLGIPSHGLVSLWDMITHPIGFALLKLHFEILQGHEKTLQFLDQKTPTAGLLGVPDQSLKELPPGEMERIKSSISLSKAYADSFDCHVLKQHIKGLERAIKFEAPPGDLAACFEKIRETLEIELRNQHFYHYPPDKAKMIIEVEEAWGDVISSFPSSKYDIIQGVDCFACGHDTAAVFHMMRVAEIGLIRLASERKVKLKKGKPLSHGQWGEIVDGLEREAKNILINTQAGERKDRMLAFYNGAASHLRALKDKYRNSVMHAHRSFNTYEAGDAIFHTKAVMSPLAARLTEGGNKRINWNS